MDIVTHMLAGALIGEAAFRHRLGRLAPIAGTLAAALPDLAVLPGWFSANPVFTLDYLCGPADSLLMLPFLSAALAAIISALTRRWQPRRCLWLFLACLLPMLSHSLLDWLTASGAQLLWPFDRTRYALDWIFFIDPWFLIILAGALLLAWRQLRRGKPARGIAGRGIAFALLYVFFLGALHHMALDRLRDELFARDLPPAAIHSYACLPVPLKPVAWNAIYTTGDSPDFPDTHTAVFWVLNKSTPRFDTIRSSPPSPATSAALATPQCRVFMDFARFPIIEQKSLPNGDAEITIYDARFRASLLSQRKPFLFRAVVAPDGAVRSTAFVQREL